MNDGSVPKQLVMRVSDCDFQREVLEKLARLEERMDTLIGNNQPGRMRDAENRIRTLERNDVRRGVYDRLVNAAITIALSVGISWHGHWGLR